jgi:hypothetical protein
MDRLESWKRKKMETDVLEERGERSEDSPNQEVMMKTFSTSAMYTEEAIITAVCLLCSSLLNKQTRKNSTKCMERVHRQKKKMQRKTG